MEVNDVTRWYKKMQAGIRCDKKLVIWLEIWAYSSEVILVNPIFSTLLRSSEDDETT
jgi:hypothetical protein